ncbi:trans-2-enoyl-CoA reductase [Cyathus striatus]|nr:trans-2-enoyl-CoA reductase [Cyathus striatus]
MFFPPRANIFRCLFPVSRQSKIRHAASVSLLGYRNFSVTPSWADRAVVYSENGDPSQVLSVLTYPSISPPPPNSANIKFLLSPINPADINVIEGVYPSKPTKTDSLAVSGKGSEGHPVYIAGNEGLAQVTAVGAGVNDLVAGDWVIMTKQQCGTWSTNKNVAITDVIKLPDASKLTEAQGATITVNPPTAYNMLTDFVQLEEGNWVIQNGANSAVGQAVIQIAAARGLNTINLVRNRDNLDELKQKLHAIGATHVLTYDDLAEKSLKDKIKLWTNEKDIRLGLNCIGGKETTLMTRYLGKDAHLVSYGAMSKQPLSLPTSLFIFKNLTCRGFWQSRWYTEKSPSERESVMRTLTELILHGKVRHLTSILFQVSIFLFFFKIQLSTPEHEIVTITAGETDEEASQRIRDVMTRLSSGRHGKKVLLKIEDKDSD